MFTLKGEYVEDTLLKEIEEGMDLVSDDKRS